MEWKVLMESWVSGSVVRSVGDAVVRLGVVNGVSSGGEESSVGGS
jgi:hypothetical protein